MRRADGCCSRGEAAAVRHASRSQGRFKTKDQKMRRRTKRTTTEHRDALSRFNRFNFAIARATTPDESRFKFDALHVTEQFTEATNGHYVIRCSTVADDKTEAPKPKAFDMLIQGKQALKVAKQMAKKFVSRLRIGAKAPKKSERVEIGKDGIAVKIENDGLFSSVWMPRIDVPKAQFPKVDAVYILMKEFAHTYGAYGSRNSTVRISIINSDKPIRLDAENAITGQSMTAHIMPVRL